MKASANHNLVTIRPLQYRDLDAIKQLWANEGETSTPEQFQQLRRWYGPLKLLSWFPNPYQHQFRAYVALEQQQVRGLIQVSPFNRTRSTWRVEQLVVAPSSAFDLPESTLTPNEVGNQLLRHCFQSVVEAHNWVVEVDINDKLALGLYRQTGFQPLAELTYWAIAPEILETLAVREADLPNLLPVTNADAQLLYQLDTVAMPPLLRQVFDRQIHDFKSTIFQSVLNTVNRWLQPERPFSGYVFELQRQAAIGYFKMWAVRQDNCPHKAELTVHPAYTWLYPELLSQMAKLLENAPSKPLHLASADYQPEREEYLTQLGAERIEHTLLMSRSVWHKVREAKTISLEALHFSEMLKSLQPSRQPIPSPITEKSSPLRSSQISPNLEISGSSAQSSPNLNEDSSGNQLPEAQN
ncbi:GNAT family N-acetyltransferase [Merismopedia glauca CCAP 1448/3]|uniref:GNAT family N-acetyltransferase n=2 Tax=Merismopedia TaxID=53402 RepID=A0A2T1BZB5_9CYAN|nr:GNAT family N-acetyltransferase [Merismopedia glauca CCAP 1448/3]